MIKRAALEFCVTDLKGAQVAREYGADRIELCTDLTTGGLTPSFGLIESCSTIIETHVLIRPRAGHFHYSEAEVDLMISDIRAAAKAGASGVVFGCLTKDQEIAIEANKRMLETSSKWRLISTFHRAFDRIQANGDLALESVIELGFQRILTSGQAPSAIRGIKTLQRWQDENNGRIQLMAGGGVGPENAALLLAAGVDALHCSIHQKEGADNPMGEQLAYNYTKARLMRKAIDEQPH